MADEDFTGGGVGTLNTGDSGSNDGTATVGGGGAGSTSSSNTGSNDTNTGSNPNNSSQEEDKSNEEIVQGFITNYLGATLAVFTFNKVVEIYVNQKLGFAKLKEEYKKNNPDADPDKVDAAVEEETAAAVAEFTEEGTASNEELKKKYDDFKIAATDALKNVQQLSKEFIKSSTEAVMPNVVGPVAPNPFSVALKIYNAISRFKRLLDRVIISMQIFMTAAKALGINETDEYDEFMALVAGPIKAVNDLISKKEADSAATLELEEAMATAKKEYKQISYDDSYYLDGNAVEKMIGEEFEFYQLPLNLGNKKKLVRKKLALEIANKIDTREFHRVMAAMRYSEWYNSTLRQVEESMKQSKTTGSNTYSGSSNGTSSGTGQSDGTFSGDTRL